MPAPVFGQWLKSQAGSSTPSFGEWLSKQSKTPSNQAPANLQYPTSLSRVAAGPSAVLNYASPSSLIPPTNQINSITQPNLTSLIDRTFNPFGGNGGGSSAAADRNYEAEKSRATQLSEQDPLFKKYQVADLTKQYNAAKASKNFDEADRIGMQIWAQTNPTLAGKVKSNQTGYGAIQSAPGIGAPTTMPTVFNPAAAQPGATTPAVDYATAPSLMQAGSGLQSGFNPTLGPDIVNNAYSIKLDPTLISDKMSQLRLQALRQKYNQGLK